MFENKVENNECENQLCNRIATERLREHILWLKSLNTYVLQFMKHFVFYNDAHLKTGESKFKQMFFL